MIEDADGNSHWVDAARLDERVRALRRENKLRSKLEKAARLLAAAEVARRLEGLNHEHERIAPIVAQGVSRERFDQTNAEVAAALGRVEKATDDRVARIEVQTGELRGKLWLPMIAIAAFVAALIETAIHMLVK